MLKTLVRSAALALVVPFALAGCGDGDGVDSEPPEINMDAEAEFVFANRGEVTMLDPNQMSWMQDIRIGQGLFEGIYRLDAATLEPILGVGSEVTHSDDFRTWTIQLRDDAKWSNGDPVTADDFVFAWRRNLRERGYYSKLVEDYVSGAKAYAEAYRDDPASADFSKVGIKKLGDLELRVDLAAPVTFFPDLLTFTVFWPMHEASMEPHKEVGDDGRIRYNADWWRPGSLVGNGAYKLARNDLKQGQTLEMNEHYWDAINTKSRTVRSVSPIEHELAYQRYSRGQIDWLTDIPGTFAYNMQQAGREDLSVFPAFGTYFWSFNTDPKLRDGSDNPLADKRVRQALSMSVDKQQIVENITRMGQMPTSVYVPKNLEYFPGYQHPEGLPFDIDRAKSLLAEAGFENGEGFPNVKLLFNTGTGDHEQIAVNLQRQWRQNLGITFDLEPVEIAQFKDRYKPEYSDEEEDGLRAGDFAITRGSWYGDYMDVSTFTDKYKSDSLNNEAGWVNAEYDRLVAEAKQTEDPQARLDLLSQAEALLLEEAAILPLYHYQNTFIKNPAVTGIPENARNMVMLQNVETPRSTGPGSTE
ncbi:MAG: peptide ABC transporter substrate-binding protein [Planctomycetota bacterium]